MNQPAQEQIDLGANPSTLVKNELTDIEKIKAALDESGALVDESGAIDEKLLLDTIEGESNLHELLLAIERKVFEYDTLEEAVKLQIDTLNKRKTRIKKSSETLRTIILSAMDKAGIDKIQGSLATMSVKKKPQGLVIVEEDKIPSKYFERVPKLKRKAITDDLKEGVAVEGAELDNGGISLMIRRA